MAMQRRPRGRTHSALLMAAQVHPLATCFGPLLAVPASGVPAPVAGPVARGMQGKSKGGVERRGERRVEGEAALAVSTRACTCKDGMCRKEGKH